MSECTNGEMRDLLPELVNGRLDAMTQLAVEAHVAECAECAAELALLRALRPALMRGPVVDAQRIAAVVRAQVPARRGAHRRGLPWRIAIAAAALLAVSAIGYAIAVRGRSAAPEVAVTPTPAAVTKDSTDTAVVAPLTPEHAPVAAPRTVPAPAPEQQVAVAPPHTESSPIATTTVASAGMLDNLSDLSDDDVRALTASLDGISSVPDADPAPGIDPLGATLDDQSGGGSR